MKKLCKYCGIEFEGSARVKYCKSSHRVLACRTRKGQPATPFQTRTNDATTIENMEGEKITLQKEIEKLKIENFNLQTEVNKLRTISVLPVPTPVIEITEAVNIPVTTPTIEIKEVIDIPVIASAIEIKEVIDIPVIAPVIEMPEKVDTKGEVVSTPVEEPKQKKISKKQKDADELKSMLRAAASQKNNYAELLKNYQEQGSEQPPPYL